MNEDFVMCTRAVKNGEFTAEPGDSLFLLVPDGKLPSPKHAVKKPDLWVKKMRKESVWGKDSRTGGERGDVLVFVHGYNNSQKTVMERHRRLKVDLHQAGFKGAIMSFDWPSAEMTLNYIEDRFDAKATAMQLVKNGIALLAAEQGPDCTINVHLLGHSTGAYVIREAFRDADDASLAQSGWVVSQIALIAGDVSAASLSQGNPSSESLYRHCVRLTNYSNRSDWVLKISNVKRLGMAPRVGRVGLPENSPPKAVNVDCTEYFQLLSQDQAEEAEVSAHSWHIGNKVFAQDLFETLRGDLDRSVIPTREKDASGRLKLKAL